MSDASVPGGGGPGAGVPGQGPGAEQQPSEEELREYLGQMRANHVGEIVAQVASALLNGAQVKLGRRDGRLLLDLAAQLTDSAGPHLDERFTQEVGQVLAQLRIAQVEAEKEVAQAQAQGHAEPNDLDQPAGTSEPGTIPDDGPGEGTDSAPSAAPRPGQPPSSGPDAASRLWTPGR